MTATAPARIAPTEDEFTALYNQHRKMVCRVVGRLVRCVNDHQDIEQDIWLIAFAKSAQFDGRSSYATWLKRIAINQCFSFLRKMKAHPLCLDGDLPAAESGTACAVVLDPARNIEDAAVDHELVENLMASLSPINRELFEMKYFEGLGQDVVSAHLGLTLPGYRVRVFRARWQMHDLAVALSTARRTGAV